MPVDQIINLLVTVTLVEMMIAIGLGVTVADVIGVVRNGRLLIRAALANYVCVPAVAVGLLVLFRAEPMVAAGFLIAAVCPGAPYGPPFTAMAKGNVAASVGLMVVLEPPLAALATPACGRDRAAGNAARAVGEAFFPNRKRACPHWDSGYQSCRIIDVVHGGRDVR